MSWIPDIECEIVACWQDNADIHYETFTMFENEDYAWYIQKVIEFSKTHDVIKCYREPDGVYINPNTGEEVYTPHLGEGTDHYALQNQCPWHAAGFTPMTDEEIDNLFDMFESSWEDQYESTL